MTSYFDTKIWRQNHPEKIKAHRLVFSMLRNGFLKRKACRKCGAKKSEAHHEDYSKPLRVIWLCKKHHVEADMKLRSFITKK